MGLGTRLPNEEYAIPPECTRRKLPVECYCMHVCIWDSIYPAKSPYDNFQISLQGHASKTKVTLCTRIKMHSVPYNFTMDSPILDAYGTFDRSSLHAVYGKSNLPYLHVYVHVCVCACVCGLFPLIASLFISQ